jgi:purine-cytosine permease-like protein
VSLQLNTIIVGACELLTNVACAFTISKINRKRSLLVIFILLLGLFVALNLIFNKKIQTFIEGLMRILDCFAMAILGVYIPELFPVN